MTGDIADTKVVLPDENAPRLIAVSWSSFEESGCVNCGCDYCYSTGIQRNGTSPVICGECKTEFVILADGRVISGIGFGSPSFHPELTQHPRAGTPKHKFSCPDIRPEAGGDFWYPRGVGIGRYGPDASGFVKSKEAGERIVGLVEKIIGKKPATWLDYRDFEPTWIQVKFQALDGFDLEKLCSLCYEDKIITEEKIREALMQETA